MTEAREDTAMALAQERYLLAALRVEMLVRSMDKAAKGEGAPPAGLLKAIAAATRHLTQLRDELQFPTRAQDPAGVLPGE